MDDMTCRWIHHYVMIFHHRNISTLSQTSPCFFRVCGANLLKTLWEKEKLLVTSNFSFSYGVIYSFEYISGIYVNIKIVICKLSIWKSPEFVWERVNPLSHNPDSKRRRGKRPPSKTLWEKGKMQVTLTLFNVLTLKNQKSYFVSIFSPFFFWKAQGKLHFFPNINVIRQNSANSVISSNLLRTNEASTFNY